MFLHVNRFAIALSKRRLLIRFLISIRCVWQTECPDADINCAPKVGNNLQSKEDWKLLEKRRLQNIFEKWA